MYVTRVIDNTRQTIAPYSRKDWLKEKERKSIHRQFTKLRFKNRYYL